LRTFSCRIVGVIALAIGIPAVAVWAQNRASSSLTVQVHPETHLDTPTASLSFTVNNPGQVATSQPVTITAWVRALPNQQIHLTAQPEALNGPAGAVPAGALRWNGISAAATGGATTATCTSGDFSTSGPQQIIASWAQSGIAKCTLTFGLVTDAAWPAGIYTGIIDLSVFAE
jgi:hypothetical protein